METYTHDTLPRFWWLRPWHHARRLHAAVTALRDLVFEKDVAIADIRNESDEVAKKSGFDPSDPIYALQRPVPWLGREVAYWKTQAINIAKERDALKVECEKPRVNDTILIDDLKAKVAKLQDEDDFHKQDRFLSWKALNDAGIDEVNGFSIPGGISVLRDQRDEHWKTVTALNAACRKLEDQVKAPKARFVTRRTMVKGISPTRKPAKKKGGRR